MAESGLWRRTWRWFLLALGLYCAARFLFLPLNTLDVAMDEARYLGLAQSFPRHSLYGEGQLYLSHPPLYPWLIALGTMTGLPDHLAGLAVSLLAVGATVWVALGLARTLGYSPGAAAMSAGFLALQGAFVDNSQVVMREGLYVLLLAGWSWSVLHELQGKRRWWPPALLGLSLVLVSDLCVLGFGVLLVCALWHPYRRGLRYLGLVGLLLLLPWLAWLLLKVACYSSSAYRLTIDGTIADTTQFGLAQVFSPAFFSEQAHSFSQGQRSLGQRVHALSTVFSLACGPWRLPGAALLAPLLLPGMLRAVRRRRAATNPELWALLFGLGLALPSAAHPMFVVRYGAAGTLGFALLVGGGLHALFCAVWLAMRRQGLERPARVARCVVPLVLGVALLALGGVYLGANDPRPRPFWGLEKRVESSVAARSLELLPGGAVMAQRGYGQELAYLLERPVVGMPYFPERLEEWIEAYQVDYLVAGDHYWEALDAGRSWEVWCAPTLAYVADHPGRFRLIDVIADDSLPHWPDRVRVWRVVREGG